MNAIRFPATLTDHENHVWSLQDTIPENSVVNYARYEHDGKSSYYLGGKTLLSVKYIDSDDLTICVPGIVIAKVH